MIGLSCHGLIFHYLIYGARVKGPGKRSASFELLMFRFIEVLSWDFVISAFGAGDRTRAGEHEI